MGREMLNEDDDEEDDNGDDSVEDADDDDDDDDDEEEGEEEEVGGVERINKACKVKGVALAEGTSGRKKARKAPSPSNMPDRRRPKPGAWKGAPSDKKYAVMGLMIRGAMMEEREDTPETTPWSFPCPEESVNRDTILPIEGLTIVDIELRDRAK